MKFFQLFCFVMILGAVTVLAFPIEDGTIHADDHQEKIHIHGVPEHSHSHESPKYVDGKQTKIPERDHQHGDSHVHEQPLVHKTSRNIEEEMDAPTLNFSRVPKNSVYYITMEEELDESLIVSNNSTATTNTTANATENDEHPALFCICALFKKGSTIGDTPFVSNVFCQPANVPSEADCHEFCKKASISKKEFGDHNLCSWTSDYKFHLVVKCIEVSGTKTENETTRRFHLRLDFDS